MVANITDKAAIAGIGSTEFSKNSGRSDLSLAVEACKTALDDAGLKPSDVDGMVTFTMDTNEEVEVARALGCNDLNFYARVPYGGGAATGTLHQATMAIATGMAEVVVCYRALNGRSGHRYSSGVAGDLITGSAIHYGWYMPFGLLTPASWVATYTQRYMYLTGCSVDAFFEVAQATREYAVNNPAAFFYQQPLTRKQYDNARRICDPLKLFDCCQESDGGSAVVVTTPERARDLRQRGVLINAVTQCSAKDQEEMTSFYRPEIARLPEMDHAAKMAYKQCGLGVDDIDCAVIYDAFTPTVLWQLESWGFCKYGEAADFVLDGNLRPGGRLPTNTHGGQLSEAYIHGVNGIAEAVRQVRGTSVNQADKQVNHALVTSGAGVPTGGAILGRMD
jgi:acetyl-CoA acetyltransferase